MASFLTAVSVLQCPHGSPVMIICAGGRAKAGMAIARATDMFTITGCQWGPPCATVQWVVPATRVKAGGGNVLTTQSVGVCQSATGTPNGNVVVISAQPRAGGV